MTVTMLVLLILLLVLVLLMLEVPVAFALGLSGALGLMLLHGSDYATNAMGGIPFTSTASYSLSIVPMFILMGVFAVRAKVASSVYAFANFVARRLPGGVGVATVMACAGFAAVSGSSVGTAAVMSKLSISEMRRYGYPDHLSAGLVAIAGTLGIMIPPSIMLVLYAILTQESVAKVLAAGIVPGILSAIAFSLYIILAARKYIPQQGAPQDLRAAVAAQAVAGSGPAASSGGSTAAPAGIEVEQVTRARDLPFRGILYMGLLFVIVMGGMYSGIVTATESAALGALAAFIMMLIEQRDSGLKGIWESIKEGLSSTASTTSMVFTVVIGSAILSNFLVAARVPDAVSNWVLGLEIPPMVSLALLLLMLVPLGMALESYSILFITVPILYPVATQLGFDGVWLAIMVVKLIEIGLVTPPVGINCFVVSASGGVRLELVFRGVLPLVLVDFAVLVVLYLVPGLSLWLPSLMQ
ncbi:MAG TPA: TRAP transporter large permease [Propionibacterium sp.]|nr:TRAP transporter large permease [Propionibacterium sp.]